MAINKQNPVRRVIPINASNGTPVIVTPSGPCRYMEISECPPTNFDNNTFPFAPQGMIMKRADDNYTNAYGIIPGAVIAFGDRQWKRDRAIGIPAGMTDPAGNTIPQSMLATVKLISATATATQVEIDEFY